MGTEISQKSSIYPKFQRSFQKIFMQLTQFFIFLENVFFFQFPKPGKINLLFSHSTDKNAPHPPQKNS